MKATVTFTRCIQDSQEYGSDDDHMISRVFFDLDVDGRAHPGLAVSLKQVAGSNYHTGDIEIGPPAGYRGPWNHEAFRDAVEYYFRSLVGSSGSFIEIPAGAPSPTVRMKNNEVAIRWTTTFEIDGAGVSGTW